MRKTNKPNKVIVHHTGGTDSNPKEDTSHHTFEIVNEYHRQKWNYPASNGVYIAYHYFIEKKGHVVSGTPNDEEGMHTKGENLTSVSICLAGNFDANLPTKEQESSLRELLKTLTYRYGIAVAHIYPHREFGNRSCYGKKLSDGWARELLQEPDETHLERKVSLLMQVVELLRRLLKLRNILKRKL